jgi:trehalose-phosphatase
VSSADAARPDFAQLAALRRRRGEAALLFDIDGTLAPITTRPGDASVPEPTRELLAQLAAAYALVGCVSGRQALAGRRMAGLDQIVYIGNHGLERLEPGAGDVAFDPALGSRADAAALFIADLDPDRLEEAALAVEDKGPIQALHWRGAPDEQRAEAVARAIAAEAPADALRPHWGRKVLELRPAVDVNKGTAVRRLLAEAPVRLALYAGDDRTDLDVFRALADLVAEGKLEAALRVGVRSSEGPQEIVDEADVVVEGTEGVRELLRELIG